MFGSAGLHTAGISHHALQVLSRKLRAHVQSQVQVPQSVGIPLNVASAGFHIAGVLRSCRPGVMPSLARPHAQQAAGYRYCMRSNEHGERRVAYCRRSSYAVSVPSIALPCAQHCAVSTYCMHSPEQGEGRFAYCRHVTIITCRCYVVNCARVTQQGAGSTFC